MFYRGKGEHSVQGLETMVEERNDEIVNLRIELQEKEYLDHKEKLDLLEDLNESLNLEYKSINEYKEEIKKLIKLYS